MEPKDETNSTDEIEITPAMIEAGVSEFALFSFEDRGEWVVSAVYTAMRRAAIEGLSS